MTGQEGAVDVVQNSLVAERLDNMFDFNHRLQ
jgi:hypothetical protein